jgi:hypothetical protein
MVETGSKALQKNDSSGFLFRAALAERFFWLRQYWHF